MKRMLIAAIALCAGFAATVVAEPAVGEKAPALSLTDANGKKVSLADHKGKYVVLEWVNLGCPFVKKHYETGNMQAAQKQATDKGAVWLSICSSAKGKQGHMDAAGWKKAAAEQNMAATSVLVDADGSVGKAYGAKTTPHMFVIDPDGNVIYKGAIDDKATTEKEDVKGAKNYVLAALDEAMGGKPVSNASTTPYGCSVKYK